MTSLLRFPMHFPVLQVLSIQSNTLSKHFDSFCLSFLFQKYYSEVQMSGREARTEGDGLRVAPGGSCVIPLSTLKNAPETVALLFFSDRNPQIVPGVCHVSSPQSLFVGPRRPVDLSFRCQHLSQVGIS